MVDLLSLQPQSLPLNLIYNEINIAEFQDGIDKHRQFVQDEILNFGHKTYEPVQCPSFGADKDHSKYR